jgi:hypothetical protein
MLVQEHLESLYMGAPTLFPTQYARAKFDFDWRVCFLKSMPSAELVSILQHGARSNSHPLRLQLVAIPPHSELRLHAHASIELDIPLIGDLWERRRSNNILMPPDMLARRMEHSFGTPLSNFSEKPTMEELQVIGQDLSERAILPDNGKEGVFVEGQVSQGDCLVNQVGSVHQSFTKEKPCLLWVLGANVHAHFLPGNFHQREGTSELNGIEDLLK